jgi:DNA-binding FadR family transcriptional regulator
MFNTRVKRQDLLPDEALLVAAIGDQEHPVGARVALRALTDSGVDISEATVSRMLSKLDSLGLTRPIGKKGRVLTGPGIEVFHSMQTQTRRDDNFDRALELRTTTEILDWLRARRVIEGEAAYLAAERATEESLAELAESVAAHERAADAGDLGYRTVGMHFHVLIARAAQSPIFEALIESLTSPKIETIESALDFITASRGTIGDSASDHRHLLGAIVDHDADRARQLMQAHLVRLEREVELFSASGDSAALLATLGIFDAMSS